MVSKFFSIEGIDGSGKSTMLKMLEKDFPNIIYSREPGGCEISEMVRSVLIDDRAKNVPPMPMLLGFAMSRSANIELVIKPALVKGEIVVSDRFDASTYAYQLFGQQNPDLEDFFWIVRNRIFGLGALNEFRPTYIYLRIDEKTAADRRQRRSFSHHYHQQTVEYHQRVYAGYEQFFSVIGKLSEKIDAIENRPHIIDASQSLEEVYVEVKKIFSELYKVDAH